MCTRPHLQAPAHAGRTQQPTDVDRLNSLSLEMISYGRSTTATSSQSRSPTYGHMLPLQRFYMCLQLRTQERTETR